MHLQGLQLHESPIASVLQIWIHQFDCAGCCHFGGCNRHSRGICHTCGRAVNGESLGSIPRSAPCVCNILLHHLLFRSIPSCTLGTPGCCRSIGHVRPQPLKNEQLIMGQKIWDGSTLVHADFSAPAVVLHTCTVHMRKRDLSKGPLLS